MIDLVVCIIVLCMRKSLQSFLRKVVGLPPAPNFAPGLHPLTPLGDFHFLDPLFFSSRKNFLATPLYSHCCVAMG